MESYRDYRNENFLLFYLGSRGGGVNDLRSLLKSALKQGDRPKLLINNNLKSQFQEFENEIEVFYLTLPSKIFDLLWYVILFKWLSVIFSIRNLNCGRIIVTMFHPLNFAPILYGLFSRKVGVSYFLHNGKGVKTFNDYRDIFLFMDRWFAFLSKEILVLSEATKKFVQGHWFLSSKKVVEIGFGAYEGNQALSIVRNAAFYNRSKLEFIFFGKILPYKGLDILVEALGLLNEENISFKCHIVGEGPLNIEINVPNVNVVNEWISDAMLEGFLSSSHFAVFPYTRSFQSGALSTAIGYKMPVVISNLESLTSLTNPFGNAIILDDISPNALASAIKEVYRDRSKLRSLQMNCNRNSHKLGWDDVWTKIKDF